MSNFLRILPWAINVAVDDYWWDIRSVKHLIITKHYEMRKEVTIAVTQLILECSLPSSLDDGKLLHLHQEIGIYLCVRIFDYNHVRISRGI